MQRPCAPSTVEPLGQREQGHKAFRERVIAGNLKHALGLQPSQWRLAVDRGAEGRRRSGEANVRIGRIALLDRKAVATEACHGGVELEIAESKARHARDFTAAARREPKSRGPALRARYGPWP